MDCQEVRSKPQCSFCPTRKNIGNVIIPTSNGVAANFSTSSVDKPDSTFRGAGMGPPGRVMGGSALQGTESAEWHTAATSGALAATDGPLAITEGPPARID